MRKTIYFTVLFICFSLSSWSQDFEKVDSIVTKYPDKFRSTSKLAKRIASDFTNDYEKVRAIYTWITNNVVYDPKEYGKYNFEYSDTKEFVEKDKKYKNKLSSRVIKKGKAVCEGYSTLFTVICDDLNIVSKVVTGSSKTEVKDIGKRYYSDHAWNIVQIENKKYLIDATWGAGTYGNHFQKKIDFFYFLTDPNLFIKTHYPDNFENALLETEIERQEFLNGPLIYNYDFVPVHPTDGVIKRGEMDKIKFVFTTDKVVTSISYRAHRKDYQIHDFKKDDYLEFEVDISQLQREKDLILFFNNEPIIAFKIE